MFESMAFFIMFGLFMLRAYMFEWKSVFVNVYYEYNENAHVISFFTSVIVLFGILFIVMVWRTETEKLLETEYKGVYVTPAEFRAGVSRDKVGEAKFSENVKCETDAD